MDTLPQQPVYAIIPSQRPSIESDRLRLRPVTDADAPALFAVRSRWEVAQMNHPKIPFKSVEETRKWMSTKVFTQGPSDVIGRSFNYAILNKSIPESQEQIIGSVSINAVHPFPEIGYALLPEAWGNGYMTEALNLLLKMWWDLPRRTIEGTQQPGEREKVFALCETQNVGSSGVLKKCSFKFVSEYRYEQDELIVWGLEKP
ncbi:hypothetical protein PENANT_c002G08735 [Penicillium antarcticum]|uniref:N-acetyltransferase domain-containing protein n=1 Tax=Penicillium antarcticum TaxID=416450 RepID=A0A1V6QKF0_9EURO|nr:hypothetical protein PENANT_c002G08735 [Penicillium antarcticum]